MLQLIKTWKAHYFESGYDWLGHQADLDPHRDAQRYGYGRRGTPGPRGSEKTRYARALLNKIKKMEVGTGFGWNWLECESQGQPKRAMNLILQNEEFKRYVEQVDRPWLWLKRIDENGGSDD